jgi:LEA14-like dessication related protein
MTAKLVIKFTVLVLAFCCTGCFVAPEFRGYQNFQFNKLENNTLKFSIDLNIDNPNVIGIRVRKSELDFSVENTYLGKARISEGVKIKRKRLNTVTLPLEIQLEKGAVFKLLRFATKKQVDIHLTGVVKGSALLVPKRQKIDEKRTINVRDLNLNLGGLMGG